MRVPKHLNLRLQRRLLLKFGEYEKVYPVEVGPRRAIPDHIVKPSYYATGVPDQKLRRAEVKDEEQIDGMRKSCQLASTILQAIETVVKVGVTTDAIDEFVHNLCIEAGAYPSPFNYKGYPRSICTSVNNVACHGIPDMRPLADGDIVNVDITVLFKGYNGDCSKTFLVGNVDNRGRELVAINEECLEKAIQACGPGVPFSHIGATIKRHAKRNRLTVMPAFLGHGIGSYFHGPPNIYHTFNRYPGFMKSGMTFTIEPVLTHGKEDAYILDDGWTAITADGARTAQVEHTILITDDGSEILTVPLAISIGT